jgi:hypothetical protein
LQIHPLVTVKKAASALGVDREVILNMIDIGAVRGERRFVKNKEKWFLYQEEVQEYLEKRAQELSDQATRTTMEGLGEFFEPGNALDKSAESNPSKNSETPVDLPIGVPEEREYEPVETVEPGENEELNFAPPAADELVEAQSVTFTEITGVEETGSEQLYLQTAEHTLDQILNSLTIEFAQRLCEERQIVCNLQQQLDERNQIMADIPDLRQKLDEVKMIQQSKDEEIAALKAHVQLLEADLSWWKKPWWNRLFNSAPRDGASSR